MEVFQHQNKQAAYDHVALALRGLTEDGRIPWESALVSLIALLKENLPVLSWVGFYRDVQGTLWVGPYQGKLACINLRPGQGVCGKSLGARETIIVEDVHLFEGHVFCDPAARSEIVVPVWRGGQVIGVLDLDSHEPAAFDAVDQKWLVQLLKGIEPLPEHVILDR